MGRRIVSLSAILLLAALFIQPGRATTQGNRAKVVQTAAPTGVPTEAATGPTIDLGGGLRLESRFTTEKLDKPLVTIEITRPLLTGTPAVQIDAFNKAADEIIAKAVEDFKKGLLEMEAERTPDKLPADLPGSTLDVSYEAITATSNLLSLRFGVGFYARGAAHPGGYYVTLNYDVKAGKVLALADLFRPNARYLQVLAGYSIKQLSAKQVLDFPEGAEPTEENYRNWNIKADGLLISFDSYQVAPYAAGPQEVVVPYSVLKNFVKADGPLAQFLK
jgi:hypothetical protein